MGFCKLMRLARVWFVMCLAMLPFATKASSSCDVAGEGISIEILGVTLNPRLLVLPDGRRLNVDEGLLQVPENRASCDSRQIAIHFLRIRSGTRAATPIVVLPGGPGGVIQASPYGNYGSLESAWGQSLVDLAAPERDLIIVNQRGIIGVPLSTSLSFVSPAFPLMELRENGQKAEALAAAFATAQQQLIESGVDVRGYDIVNMVEDIDAVRRALGYERIILMGGSFGSEWSLAYARTYPQRVERMVLDGVEPLTHTYDSPAALDRTLLRILAEADRTDEVHNLRPAGGFQEAFQIVYRRLELEPMTVQVQAPGGEPRRVLIDERDFVQALVDGDDENSLREVIANMPRRIHEAFSGDFSFVARHALATRGPQIASLAFYLIDSSLGIDTDRDRQLLKEAATSFVGEVNLDYRAVRDVVAVPVRSSEWRALPVLQMAVLVMQGTFDLSTPVENVDALLGSLPRATYLRVQGGSHDVFDELASLKPESFAVVHRFLAGEDTPSGVVDVKLPPIAFRGATHE